MIFFQPGETDARAKAYLRIDIFLFSIIIRVF